MREELDVLFDQAQQQMQRSIAHLERELLKIRAGKASPAMLGGVMVDYYGTLTPLHRYLM